MSFYAWTHHHVRSILFLMAALFADDWQAVDISGDDIAADASAISWASPAEKTSIPHSLPLR